MTGTRGSGVIEALAAMTLAAVALAGISASVVVAARVLHHGGEASRAAAAALDALDRVRVGAATSGADVVGPVPGFDRRWDVEEGRGAPARVHVAVRWDGRRIDLESSTWR